MKIKKLNESKSIKTFGAAKSKKLDEASEGFEKEFYNDYVILKNRAGDGYDIYSYDGTPEKVTKAYLEDEGYATLKDAKAEIDKWIEQSMDESIKTFGAKAEKLNETIEPQNNGYHNIWPINNRILVHNDGGVYHVIEKDGWKNTYIYNTESIDDLNQYLQSNFGETIVDPNPKEKPIEEPKKRYPLYMWKKIEDAVKNMDNIPEEHKEQFISLVGDRATTKKIPKVGYKSSLLPATLRSKYGERANYNHLIVSPESYNTTLEQALTDIYDAMKFRWFTESLSEEYKVKFFQVFEAPKSPKENGKMIGQRSSLEDANAFGKDKVGEGNYIIKAVCTDGQVRHIDNDTKSDAFQMEENLTESKELWDSARVIDLVKYYLDRGNPPINTLANQIMNDMKKEGSKLPYNITDFYDALYKAVDNYNDSLEEDINAKKFNVGDTFEYSGLYGGSQHCEVTKVTDDYIECKVSWTSEDDGKEVSDASKFILDTDENGNQCAIVWEYHGEKGRVYPNQSINESKESEESELITQYINNGEFDKLQKVQDGTNIIWKLKESANEDIQYGVHQFSTNSIIFRGTEEECGKYIDDRKELWDDAEVYMMTPDDPHYKKDLDEASYGGAFDIEDDQLFTREDIEYASEDVIGHINETFDDRFQLGGTWFENGEWIVNVQTEDGMEEYEEKIKIDSRKIRNPFHDLKNKYALEMAARLISQIKKDKYGIDEDQNISDTVARELEEALSDYKFEVSCNDGPTKIIKTIAADEDKAIKYVKDMYAQEHTTYADDRENKWNIKNLNESITTDAEPIKTDSAYGVASILNGLIVDEYEAIEGYNTAIVNAQAEGYDDMVKVLTEIQAEENIHVGQLIELMKMVDPNADKIIDGMEEGKEQLSSEPENNPKNSIMEKLYKKVIRRK